MSLNSTMAEQSAASRSRNAHPAPVVFPTGRLEHIHNFLNYPDISTRLVHFDESAFAGLEPGALSPSSLTDYAQSLKSAGAGSSMAPTTLVHQSTASSAYPPSLYSCTTNTTDVTPTETSVSTGLASHLSGVPLLEENNGVLEVPQRHVRAPLFECAFWFLNCHLIFTEQEGWETHCLAHFHGEEPPKTVQCPLCEWSVSSASGFHSWHARMQHLATTHTMMGQSLRTSRPDFGLFQHLWQKRLIDAYDLKELKGGNHNLTRSPGNHIEIHRSRGGGRERNGRLHPSQHISSRQPVPRQVVRS